MNRVLLKILALIQEKGITEKQFLNDLYLNRSTLCDWKKGVSASYKKHIDKISKYFGVTTDYLLTCDNEWYEDYYEDYQNANELQKMYLIEKWGIPSNYVDVALFYFAHKNDETLISGDMLSKEEVKLINTYRKFNKLGKEKTNAYIEDLITNPKYVGDYFEAPYKLVAFGGQDNEGTQPPIEEKTTT